MEISFNGIETNSRVNSLNDKKEVNTESVNHKDVHTEEKKDSVELSTKQEKKSIWQGFKDDYTSFRKFFVTLGEYTKGTLKGLVYGGTAVVGILGTDALRGMVKKSSKVPSTKGKIAAGIAGAAVFTYNLFNASLNANSRKANIDHRWQTGHDKV